MKKYLFVAAGLCFLGAGAVKGQTLSHGEQVEITLSFWASTLEQVRLEASASRDEFAVFQRFYAHSIDSLYGELTNKILANKIVYSNVNEYMQAKKPYLAQLFNSFRKVELDYPSSVSEYKTEHRPRIGMDSCFPSCYNTGFEDGTFNGWYGYYGVNTSTFPGPFNISDITGGYLGAVTKAAQDPNTNNDYQLRITSGTATDWFLKTYSTYTMPQVAPWGGIHSVMMGDSNTALQGVAILSQTFQVTAASPNLTLEYSLFLEDPYAHTYYQQPFFSALVIDRTTDDTIPVCGEYLIDATNHPASNGFKAIWYPAQADTVYWMPWTLQNVSLQNYIGHCVSVIFQIQDCSLGGHFGYAYVDASCSIGIVASSPDICGNDSVSLTAPPVGAKYMWTGPVNGIVSNDTLQTISVDSAGAYTVVCIPATGPYCADTLTIMVGKINGIASVTASALPALISVGDSSLLTTTCNVPASFVWSPSSSVRYPDSSQSYAHPAVTTTYTLTVSTPCGILTDTVTVFVGACTNNYNEPICIATVDTATNKAEVIWGRTNSPPATGSYSVYKDSILGYELTHTQPLNILSEYADPFSTPSAGPVSYELATVDSCGQSVLSAPHTTIYLQVTSALNVYILNWTAYIGFTPSKYRIFRGPTLGTVVQIDSVSSAILSYHDTLPPSGSVYLVEAVNPSNACVPSMSIKTHRISSSALAGSYSNGFNASPLIVTGVKQVSSVTNLNIYPNPNNGMVNVSYSLSGNGTVQITIVDELGQIVYDNSAQKTVGSYTEQINLESLASGIYSLRMQTDNSITVKKVVVMKK